jgi:hypothetical protein
MSLTDRPRLELVPHNAPADWKSLRACLSVHTGRQIPYTEVACPLNVSELSGRLPIGSATGALGSCAVSNALIISNTFD